MFGWISTLLGAPKQGDLLASAQLAAAAAVGMQVGRRRALEDNPRSSALGGAGTLIRSGFIDALEFNTEVRGHRWYGDRGTIGLADRMARDPIVAALLDGICNPLTSARWVFRPASKSPLDVEIAKVATWAFVRRLPWRRILRRVVRGYTMYGCALEEVTEEFAQLPEGLSNFHPTGRAIVPKRFSQRKLATIYKWHQSPQVPEEIAAVEQWLMGSDTEKPGSRMIPAERLARWTYDQDEANFEGQAPMRDGYGAWKIKQLVTLLDSIKNERLGVPTPAATLPEGIGDDDIRELERMLDAYRSHEKSYIVLANGTELEFPDVKGIDLGVVIERCNKDLAFRFGQGFRLLGLVGPGKGSYALAMTQDGHLHLLVEHNAMFYADGFNHGTYSPVRRFVDVNYGTDIDLPVLEARGLPTRNWDSVAARYFDGVQKGALTADDATEDELRRSMDLPEHDPETAREKKTLQPEIAPPQDDDDDGDESPEEKKKDEESDDGEDDQDG